MRTLRLLDADRLDAKVTEGTLGSVLKYREDLAAAAAAEAPGSRRVTQARAGGEQVADVDGAARRRPCRRGGRFRQPAAGGQRWQRARAVGEVRRRRRPGPARTRSELYWLARITLVDDPGQLAAFDPVFRRLFGGVDEMTDVAERRGDLRAPEVPAQRRPGAQTRPPQAALAPASDVPSPGRAGTPLDLPGEGRERKNGDRLQMTASAEERLRHKDFAAYTPDELAALRRLVAALRVAAPQRRVRRTARATAGRRLDLRRTLRRARHTGGDPCDGTTGSDGGGRGGSSSSPTCRGPWSPTRASTSTCCRGRSGALAPRRSSWPPRLTRVTRAPGVGDPDGP